MIIILDELCFNRISNVSSETSHNFVIINVILLHKTRTTESSSWSEYLQFNACKYANYGVPVSGCSCIRDLSILRHVWYINSGTCYPRHHERLRQTTFHKVSNKIQKI